MNQRGFTVVEIIITISIMGILLLLTVVGVNGSQANARDSERKADIEVIGTQLESFYNSGLPTTSSVPTITNQATNPSAETNLTSLCATNIAIARTTAWASSGSYSASLTPTGASNDSFMCLEGDTGAMRVGMQAGKTYTLSAVLYIPVSLTGNIYAGRAGCITAWWYASGAYDRTQSCAPTTAGIYTLSVTFSLPSNATQAFIRLYNGTDIGGGIVYYDSIMLVEGSNTYNFGDGNTENWSWTGTSNNSSSIGPAIIRSKAGTYPSITAASSIFNMYFPDIDSRALTAPGQLGPTSSFIPATNATQTTAGVLPQPTINQYVYQPINSTGGLCYNYDCRKFNLYYRLEKDNTVYMVTSKNQ